MMTKQVPSNFKGCMDKNYLTAHWWLIKHGLPQYFKTDDLGNGQHRIYAVGLDSSEYFLGRLPDFDSADLSVLPTWTKRFWLLDSEYSYLLVSLILRCGLNVKSYIGLKPPRVQGHNVDFSMGDKKDITNFDMRSEDFASSNQSFCQSILMAACYELEARKRD